MNEQDLSNRIRQYVDGELEPDEGTALLNRIESDKNVEARARFEQLLRDRVSRAMLEETAGAPAGLADQIRSALAEAPPEPEVAGRLDPSREGAEGSGGDERAATPKRRSWYVGPQRVNFLAVAAVALLITSVVLFSIFSPRIDEARFLAGSDLACEIAQFTNRIHGLCADDADIMEMKRTWPVMTEAEDRLAQHLGVPVVPLVDLSIVGYDFVGAGKCHVPGIDAAGREIPSGHAVYQKRGKTEPAFEDLVSVFMAPNVGQFAGQELLPGRWYELGCGDGDGVLCMSDGSVLYVLVCGDPSRAEELHRAVGMGLAAASGNR